ncbi:hypothetical protein ACFY3U_14405 [Micromonospora sp. NPDC000089]|uniref:hypothetical protein n=1 Tax=unclassified Micromonospora TaxID=2617518 RepID=UPI0036A3E92A
MCRLAAALLFLAALAGCAEPGSIPESAISTGQPEWTTSQAEVTGVRVAADPRSLVLTLALPGGADGCSRGPRVTTVTEENGRIYANVVHESRLTQVVGACPTHTPGEVTLTVPGPVGGRTLVLNQEPWKRTGDTYGRCDATFGCDPMPADHCDPAWISVAVGHMDVSRHSTGSVEGCDGRWLVMTVPFDPVPCGVEARPSCAPTVDVRRYFLRWRGGDGWVTVAGSTQVGCGTIRTVEPAFPAALCARLPRP